MIAYDGSGRTLALIDGAELLVHDGPSEGPRWRRQCPVPLVAVGATPSAVVAVDRDGAITWFEPDREVARASAAVGEPVHAAAVSPEGHVLVATSSGARVYTPDGPGPQVPFADARVVAWAPAGRFLVAGAGGKVGEFAADGTPGATAQLDGAPVAAAHNSRGFWVVATSGKLLRFQHGALHHLTNAPGDMPVRAVACSADGSQIALALGDALALVLSWPERDTVGQLRYLDRKVEGLAFGPEPWLAVALDGGDGNKLDMLTGALHRTDTQPGRPHRRWMVQVSVEPSQMPTQRVRAEPSPAPPAPENAAYSPPAAPAPAQASVATILAVLGATLAVIWLIARIAL